MTDYKPNPEQDAKNEEELDRLRARLRGDQLISRSEAIRNALKYANNAEKLRAQITARDIPRGGRIDLEMGVEIELSVMWSQLAQALPENKSGVQRVQIESPISVPGAAL